MFYNFEEMTFEEFLGEWRGDSQYIEARTSGSTGEPKIIRLSKSFVRDSALRTNQFFSITKDSRLHSCVAADFIGGKMMAVRGDLAECVFSYEVPSNRPLTTFEVTDRIDLLAVVPSQMIHILDNLSKMPVIGAIIIGGSAIDPLLKDRIMSSGLNAFETYGMTETSSHIALRKIAPDEEWFETLEDIKVSLDDRGCLVIDFTTGEHIVTNDIAVVDSDSRFKITGRWDQVIITGGKKVNPYEVERIISPLIDAPFVITSVADIKWGRKIVLRIEGDNYCREDELMSRMRELIPSWKLPKEIEWVKALPRTANGKLKR